jgi:transaldolase
LILVGQSPSSAAERDMTIFIDSADPKEIADCATTGLIDSVATNPSLAAKTGLNF